MRAALLTLGCKLNQAETVAMEELLLEAGYEIVPFDEPADVYVVNTCTVTGKSDYRSRQAIRRAASHNRNALVVVTGCYAQMFPQEASRINGVGLVIGNAEKNRLPYLLREHRDVAGPVVCVEPLGPGAPFSPAAIREFTNHTRAFVKVQDGCDFHCAYCIVRHARGPARSQPPQDVLDQVRELVGHGYTELVLTGVNLGRYGRDLAQGPSLAKLLWMVAEVDGVVRVRLSSVEPSEVTDELIECIAGCEKVCPHMHIPLQSGNDDMLSAMRRPYRSRHYAELIERLHYRVPGIGIGTDVMVGFPGETEDRWRSTYGFVEGLSVTYLHVFNYSRRPGTAAADMPGQVDPETRRARSCEMRSLGAGKALEFRRRNLGRVMSVLVESTRDKETGMLKGLTGNYIRVLLEGGDSLMNRYVSARLERLQDGLVIGSLA